MRADVVAKALDKNIYNKNESIIYLSPKGKKFDQTYAKKILKKNINIICGHFEGVDQRLLETRNIEEISIGDFILSGGESALYVVLDSILRLIPGVVGNKDSIIYESLSFPEKTSRHSKNCCNYWKLRRDSSGSPCIDLCCS